MAKIKLTKNELKKQKDSLKRFKRYLPTLQLKKQQLQMELRGIDENLQRKNREYKEAMDNVSKWVAVFGEEAGLADLISVKEVITEQSNIAGVDIPVFKEVLFDISDYNLLTTPLWVDSGVDFIKKIISVQAEKEIIQKQYDLIKEELTVTTQRVNLFEKVKIPETNTNIKVIQIFLGDQQTAAVVRGKISKKALMAKQENT